MHYHNGRRGTCLRHIAVLALVKVQDCGNASREIAVAQVVVFGKEKGNTFLVLRQAEHIVAASAKVLNRLVSLD